MTAVTEESRPSAIDAAQRRAVARSIIERAEEASGRAFDVNYRDVMLTDLAMKPVAQLDSILRDSSHGLQATPLFLGSSQGDLVYNPVAPCRIFDTRGAGGGPIAAGTQRFLRVTGQNFTAQGGVAGNCGVPFGPATVAVINFTAVGAQATGPGNLAVTPAGNSFANSSIINWTAGVNIANAVTVPMCDPNQVTCLSDISLLANVNSVNVVGDVLGWFAAPVKTSVDVQAIFGTFFACGASMNCEVTQPCNAGYTVTGGGCELANFTFSFYWVGSFPSGNGWRCQGTNANSLGGASQSMRAWTMCTRTPGR